MTLETRLSAAYTRLRAKGLISNEIGRISARDPGSGKVLSVAGQSRPEEISSATNSIESLIFARRTGIGAVIVAQPCWGSALSQLDQKMPPLFDEQVRQLGPSVETLCWTSGENLSASDDKKLHRGDTVYLWRDHVVVLGYTLDRAVMNLELFEKCAKSFVLAAMTGQRISLIPWWVRLIAFGRLRRDEKKAAEAYSQGRLPEHLGSY